MLKRNVLYLQLVPEWLAELLPEDRSLFLAVLFERLVSEPIPLNEKQPQT